MKKLICFCLGFMFAAMGFAQELKFDGYINSGLGFAASNEDGAKPLLRAYGADSERLVGRFRLNGAYTNADKTTGANFRLQVQGSHSAPNASNVGLAFGYGWIKPFGGILNLKAGFVDDSTWETADALFKDDNGEGLGMLLRLSPVDGLDLGGGAYTAAYASSDNNNVLDTTPGNPLGMDDVKYVFNAAYTMKDMFRIGASYRGWNDNNSSNREKTSQLLGEFRLLAVKDLTAVAVVQVADLAGANDFSDYGRTTIYETIGYRLGDFGFGLNAAQFLSNRESDKDPALLFNPWLSYAFGSIVPRLELAYFMGGGAANAGGLPHYYRRIGAYSAKYDSEQYAFIARPSVKFNIDSKTALEIGDAVFYQDTGDFRKANGDALLTNIFYVELVVRF